MHTKNLQNASTPTKIYICNLMATDAQQNLKGGIPF